MSIRALRIIAASLTLLGVGWILVMGNVIGMLLLLAAAGFFVRSMAGSAAGAPPFWMQSSVLAAGFFGLVAVLVLALHLPEVHGHSRDLQRLEADLVETKSALESIRFDANGNVPDAERSRFETAMSRAKHLPTNLKATRDSLRLRLAISGGATLLLVGCAVVIARARRRRTDSNSSRSPVTPTWANP
jgi:membrane protein implicated in regulation of membrane protease activity